jgi:NADH dehydrogenase [ubiquinone] 1 alpha subcomplex assembly factor 1
MQDREAGQADTPPVAPLLVVDFASPAEVDAWSAVDDVVMGGASTSALVASGRGSALFVGEVRLDNGGGFASVHSPNERRGLAEHRGLRVRFRGDGQRYKLRVRTSAPSGGVAYQARFVARPGVWSTVELAFEDFVPVRRGAVVPGAPHLDPRAIVAFDLLISDQQAGRFVLELASIEAI